MRIAIALAGFAIAAAVLAVAIMWLFYLTLGKALLVGGWVFFALAFACAGLLGGVKQVCPYCGHFSALDYLAPGGSSFENCSNCGRPALGFRGTADVIAQHGAIGCFFSIPVFLILWAIFAALSFPAPGIDWPPMEEFPSLTYTIGVTGYVQAAIWSWRLAGER